MRTTVPYMGHLIHRNIGPGYRLRWYCIGVGSSDTLAGVKELIRGAKRMMINRSY